MASPKIFVTGVTGYIGGDAFYELYAAHPDWEYTCLVRNSDRGAKLVAQYPRVRLVYGDFNSSKLLSEEAMQADIVLDCASADNIPMAEAITAGLAAHPPTATKYWIHTSGTGILCYRDMDLGTYGEASHKVYDDAADVAELTTLPDHAPHRDCDKVILAAGSGSSPVQHDDGRDGPIKTAIVCPPTIYGTGRGQGNTRSIQLPELAKSFLQKGHGFYVGAGETYWCNVHVHDLSKVYLKLVEAAANGGEGASWGAEGYYFAEGGEHIWGNISRKLAKTAKKLKVLDSDEVKSITADEAEEMLPGASMMWASNSRCRASRARKELGWEPKEESIEDSMTEVLEKESKALDSSPGHAAVAAGDA